jgi:hypothetical protein
MKNVSVVGYSVHRYLHDIMKNEVARGLSYDYAYNKNSYRTITQA